MLSSIGPFMPKRKREDERSEEGDAGIAVLPCLLALPLTLLIVCCHGAHMIMNPNCRPPSPKRTWDNEYQLLPSPLPLPSLLAVGQFRNGGYIISEYSTGLWLWQRKSANTRENESKGGRRTRIYMTAPMRKRKRRREPNNLSLCPEETT